MSDGLTITSGGAISVDSEAIRAVGRRLAGVAKQVRRAAETTRRAQHTLMQIAEVPGYVQTEQIAECAYRLDRLGDDADRYATAAQTMADVFELVELRTQQNLMSASDPRAALAVEDRIHELLASDPTIEASADSFVAAWQEHRFDGLTGQRWDAAFDVMTTAAFGVLGAAILRMFYRPIGSTMAVGLGEAVKLDLGVLPPGTTLHGAQPAVSVKQITSERVAPASNLKEVMERVPSGSRAQVAVEKYTMKDGSTRFVTYIDGTRQDEEGNGEPWDMQSNVDMYLEHHRTASHQAVLEALRLAGANPGDAVDIAGYSQGAMIGSFVAMDSPYAVNTVIVAGDPVEPTLRPDQTLVSLQNEADPVHALALGGTAGGTGSPDSFTVVRDVADRASPIDPHLRPAYVETAAQADASGDVRVKRLDDTFFAAELGQAVSVERMEFSAERG